MPSIVGHFTVFSARGWIVVASELAWIVGPALIAALLARTLRRSAS